MSAAQASIEEPLDIAVVGGGVSGLYAAWRLLSAESETGPIRDLISHRPGGRLRLSLFEFSQRLGGRLFSMTLPGVPHLPIELGGMRFLTSHARVVALVRRFALTSRELAVTDPEKRNLYYLRGRHFTADDWGRPAFVPPYQLERGERGRSPGELLIEVALKYRNQAEELRNVGFWNLLLEEYSDEAYRLIRDGGGYDSIVSNWSAAEAIPFLLADFDPRFRYLCLNEGFQALASRLAADVTNFGGDIRTGRRLHRLDLDGDLIKLTFDAHPGPRFDCRRTNRPETVYARRVILALPRRSIERLHPDSFPFASRQFEADVDSVLAQPALKIFAAYRRPWWTATRGIREGRSVTDLPMRQCYYWGTESSAPGGESENSNSILMASYSDSASVEFWAGLARQAERYNPPPGVFPPNIPIHDPIQDLSAPQVMVGELQAQLRELHGLGEGGNHDVAQMIQPYVAMYKDWNLDPFGGGWHFWRIGADARRVMKRMRQPIRHVGLHVCGEAWSRQQGWVEGALETADDMLSEVFSIPPLSTNDDLSLTETNATRSLRPDECPDLWHSARFR